MPERHAQLGDRRLSRVGLGTNRLQDAPDHHAFLREAVEAGLDFIDTAHLYTSGQSEASIGAALAPFPDELTVATKGGYRPGEGKPDVLRAQVEESLRRLRTERIALYYLHRVDPETPLENSLGVLAELREKGTIEHIGLSAVGVEEIERARKVVPIAAVQNEYHPGDRSSDPVIEYCEREGVVFVPYYPLASVPPAAEEIAAEHGATPYQVILAWHLGRSPVVAPIPGTLSAGHLRENLAALELTLTDEEWARLEQA